MPRPVIWQVAVLAVYILMTVLLPDSDLLDFFSAGLLVAVYILLLLGLRQLIEIKTLPDYRLWQFVVVAVAIWALGRLFEVGSLVLTGSMAPIPSIADLLRLAGFLAITAGLVVLPVSEGRRFGRARDLLDVMIVVGGSLVLFFLVVMQPAMQVGIDSPVMILWAGLPPAFDLTIGLLAIRLRLLAQTKLERNYLGLFALAFALRIPSDLAIGYGLLRPDSPLANFLDIGWLLSPMALTLSAHLRKTSHFGEIALVKVESSWKRLASRIESLLPASLAYLVAGYTVMSYWLLGELDLVGLASTAVLGVLLVARQGVVAGQAEMKQHAALVNAAADLAFICNSSGEIMLANPALRAATGIATELLEEKSLSDLLAEPIEAQILKQGIEGGWSGEVHLLDAHDHKFPVALSLRPVPDERNHQVMLAGTAHDLTALKKREGELHQAFDEIAEARKQLEVLNLSLEEKVEDRTQELAETIDHLEKLNEELKELDRLKSEFVTLVSHELRGPLTNIRSGVELALSRADGLPPSAEETLSLVSAETERLVSFVEIILDLSALEAGRFPLERKEIPIGVLSRAVASRFPQDKNRRIMVEISENTPAVLADEQALTSVLFHLIDNALKYAPSGPVQIQAEKKANLLIISVRDHGPGIPAQDREAVFDRFHRLDTRDSREIYGHGLGLHLSRQLLRAMGGDIEVDQHDGGTQMQFWLPLSGSKVEAKPAP